MIQILIALFALLVGFLPTRIYYKKKISSLVRSHRIALDSEFHSSFESGWREGIIEGKKKGRLEMIKQSRTI